MLDGAGGYCRSGITQLGLVGEKAGVPTVGRIRANCKQNLLILVWSPSCWVPQEQHQDWGRASGQPVPPPPWAGCEKVGAGWRQSEVGGALPRSHQCTSLHCTVDPNIRKALGWRRLFCRKGSWKNVANRRLSPSPSHGDKQGIQSTSKTQSRIGKITLEQLGEGNH